MATIKEDYVSFETAKLLKEKGFDVPCLAHWFIGSEAHEKFSDCPFNWNEVKSDLDWLSRPTHQMVMKWLREIHSIPINVLYNPVYYYHYKFQVCLGAKEKSNARRYDTYEQACEVAIKYCLEHLI